MFTFITLMNSLLCFTIIVSYIVLSLQHINDKLSTFLINPLVSSIYIDVIHTISVMLTNTTIILITKMFINIIVCFVTNITSCCNSRHSITYIHKLCQSYGEFKQTSPSYDTVKHNVVLLVLMIFYGSRIDRACIVFLGLSTSVGVPGTVAGASTGLAVDALISGQFPFSRAPYAVHRYLYPSVDTFLRRVIVFSYKLLRYSIQNGIK